MQRAARKRRCDGEPGQGGGGSRLVLLRRFGLFEAGFTIGDRSVAEIELATAADAQFAGRLVATMHHMGNGTGCERIADGRDALDAGGVEIGAARTSERILQFGARQAQADNRRRPTLHRGFFSGEEMGKRCRLAVEGLSICSVVAGTLRRASALCTSGSSLVMIVQAEAWPAGVT